MRTPEPVDSITLSGGNQTTRRDKVIVSYCHKDKNSSTSCSHILVRFNALIALLFGQTGTSNRDRSGSARFNQQWPRQRQRFCWSRKIFWLSDFIHNHELGPLLKDAEAGGVIILWVLVRACNWNATPLQHLQAAYATDRPLAQMKAERDAAWVTICAAIEAAANIE